MRRRRLIALTTALAVAGTLALTGSALGPVTSSEASPGISFWRADLDAASTAIPTPAQPTVTSPTKSLIRARAGNTKATAVAAASTTCDGCSGEATTMQVFYYDGRGAAAADNVANAVSQCPDCKGPVSASAVSVQVVIAQRADQLTVNNRSFAANVACGPLNPPVPVTPVCTTTASAVQFVIVGGSRRDLTAAAKNTVGQLQDVLAGRLATAAKQPQAAARASAQAETQSIADQLEAILVQDTGSTTVQRYIDVQVG